MVCCYFVLPFYLKDIAPNGRPRGMATNGKDSVINHSRIRSAEKQSHTVDSLSSRPLFLEKGKEKN